MADNREVKVKMSFDIGDDAAKALKDIGDAAKVLQANIDKRIGSIKSGEYASTLRANRQISQMERLERVRSGEYAAGIAGGKVAAAAEHQAGLNAKYGSTIGGIAGAIGPGALGTATRGIEMASAITRVGQSQFTTQDQKARQIAGIIPGGSLALGVADTVSGRAAGMEVAQYNTAFMGIDDKMQRERASFGMGFNPAQAGRQELANQYAGGRATGVARGDRSTVSGDEAFRQESRLYPLRVAAAKAEREGAAATKERLASENELVKLSRTENRLAEERSKLDSRLLGAGSGVDRQVILGDMGRNEEYRIANAQQMRQAAQSRMDAINREATTKAEGQRAAAGVFGAQAAQSEERAGQAYSQAVTIGGMNPNQRAKALNDLRIFKENGGEGLPQSIIDGARSIDPEYVEKQLAKVGQNTEEFKEARKITGRQAGTAEEFQAQASDFRQKQADAEYDAEKGLTAVAAQAGKDMATVVAGAIRTLFDNMKQSLLTQTLQGRNQV